ncbi:hypothetical protein KSS87_017150 [Heliosperma pusillum]|nr:hypothetical protein KSS87_017150 [Heliosperma pusillum]
MSNEQPIDWSEIHQDILHSITKHLNIYSDYIRIRAVCRTWRSLIPPSPLHHLPTQLPWLLLQPPPPSSSSNAALTRRAFYDVTTGKTHTIHLPEASYPRRILGSSHGSLIIVDDSPYIFCFNPITNFKVFLAPLSTLPGVVSFSFSNVGREYSIQDPFFPNTYTRDLRQICDTFLSKVVLSDLPTKDACLALAVISFSQTTELAYCKCGDDTWKPVPCGDFNAQDVIYSQSEDLFYSVNQLGDVAYFSTVDNIKIVKNVDTIEGDLKYLVKSNEELLLVARHLEDQADLISYYEAYETTGIRVFKFREVGKGRVQWDLVTDVGDLMVFIGNNLSLGLLASDFAGCKGNCIYWADDHAQTSEAGVYDLSNGHIEALPCCPEDGSARLPWAPPVWFTPNPF